MPVATRWPLVGRRDEIDVFTAALDDPRCQGICVYGRSGVGKTRLGQECLAAAARLGRRTVQATPDESGRAVPLSAIAHLLPDEALRDWQQGDSGGSVARTQVLRATLRSLLPAADESGPPVLLVDDAHRLDRSSLTLVDQLLAHGGVFGLATVNTSEQVPDLVTHWWRDERARRIDLDELDPVAVDTLLHVVLQGALDGGASTELWQASHGNLLVLHELVQAALDRGSLVDREGIWRLEGPLGATPELRDVVAGRIAGLTADCRAAVELLSVCQPVGLHELESSFGFDNLETLERMGLITVHADGRRSSVRLAHPMHAEVIRAGIAADHVRRLLLGHAATLSGFGARRREDPLRIATLQLEASGHADPELLRRGAALAVADQDFPTAARLAEAALADDPDSAGALVLGTALHHLGSFADADAALVRATVDAEGSDLVAITGLRQRNRFVGRLGDSHATSLSDFASTSSQDVPAQAELVAVHADIVARSGSPREALDLLARIDDSVPRVRVLATAARSVALAMIGDTARALALSREAYGHQLAMTDSIALPSHGGHHVNELFALVQSGALATADDQGRVWLEAAIRDRAPADVAALAIQLARCALARGRVRAALDWAARATSSIDAHRLDGFRPIAAALRAAAHGQLSDEAASTAAADQVDTMTDGFGAFVMELPLGRAWALAASGDVRAARRVLIGAAERAEAAGFVPTAAQLLHDAVRMGETRLAERLAGLAASTDSRLVAVQAEHAAAAAAADPPLLAACAVRFEELDALLAASEALALAADIARRQQDEHQADQFEARSESLSSRCDGAATPALVHARVARALSDRERAVAELASAGFTSREIADRLSLSARTVDNHLGRIYSKLGVANRAELAQTLAPTRSEEDPA